MTNSFVTSLTALNAASVTNANSLFFFAQDNDTPKLVSAPVLESIFGKRVGCLVHVTSTCAASMSASSSMELVNPIQFDTAQFDDLGQFNASSAGLITSKFTGWAQVKTYVRIGSGAFGAGGGVSAVHHHRIRVLKNDNIIPGAVFQEGGFDDGNDSSHIQGINMLTAPFTLAIGDTITADYAIHRTTNNSIQTMVGGFLWLKPIAVQLVQ